MTKSLIAFALLREIIDGNDPQWIVDEHSREDELSSASLALAFSMDYLKNIYQSQNRTEFRFPVNIPITLINDAWAQGYTQNLVEFAMGDHGDIALDYPDGRADDALLLHLTVLMTLLGEIALASETSPLEAIETLHREALHSLIS